MPAPHHDTLRKSVRRLRMWAYEREAWESGFTTVAGVDEAGRGPLAGPIVAAAVILAKDIRGLHDSKRLTTEEREKFFAKLHDGGHAVAVSVVEPADIDRHGIQSANYRAMAEAAAGVDPAPAFLLVDGFSIRGCALPHRAIVKGDALSRSIAAASVVAKVTRDRIMANLAERYPEYGFERHKGYGTAEHLAAIDRYGPCPVHRKTFAPLGAFHETELMF